MAEDALTTGFTIAWPWLLLLAPVPWLPGKYVEYFVLAHPAHVARVIDLDTSYLFSIFFPLSF